MKIEYANTYDGVEHTDRGCYVTFESGRNFYPLDPRPEEVHIEDIARGLSKLCRFNGHVSRIYTTAEHSLLMSYMTDDLEEQRWALLHDAPEYVVGDMVRPMKEMMPDFDRIETGVMKAIVERFGLVGDTMPPNVKHLDNVICSTEQRDLRGLPTFPGMPAPAEDFTIPKAEPSSADIYKKFMRRFHELFPSHVE